MLDVKASYPNGESCFNISKKTTHLELIFIEGISEQTRRMQGINLSSGATNAVEFCTHMLGLPTPVEWEEAFLADKAAQQLGQGNMDITIDVPMTPYAFQNATLERNDYLVLEEENSTASHHDDELMEEEEEEEFEE